MKRILTGCLFLLIVLTGVAVLSDMARKQQTQANEIKTLLHERDTCYLEIERLKTSLKDARQEVKDLQELRRETHMLLTGE